MTWFKRDQEIHWFHPEDKEAICFHTERGVNYEFILSTNQIQIKKL